MTTLELTLHLSDQFAQEARAARLSAPEEIQAEIDAYRACVCSVPGHTYASL